MSEEINEIELTKEFITSKPLLILDGKKYLVTGWNYYGGGYAESLEVYLDIELVE